MFRGKVRLLNIQFLKWANEQNEKNNGVADLTPCMKNYETYLKELKDKLAEEKGNDLFSFCCILVHLILSSSFLFLFKVMLTNVCEIIDGTGYSSSLQTRHLCFPCGYRPSR